MAMIHATIATVTRADGGILIGGVRSHQSAPFEHEEHAARWAHEIMAANVLAGRTGPTGLEARYKTVKVRASLVILASEID